MSPHTLAEIRSESSSSICLKGFVLQENFGRLPISWVGKFLVNPVVLRAPS
ncbi:MAG: hypothetical protein ABSA72_05440 [Nitrososphaerales archaeon]